MADSLAEHRFAGWDVDWSRSLAVSNALNVLDGTWRAWNWLETGFCDGRDLRRRLRQTQYLWLNMVANASNISLPFYAPLLLRMYHRLLVIA